MLQDVSTRKINEPVEISTSGDNIIIPAITDGWIYIHELIGDAAGVCTMQLITGTTVVAEFSLDAGQGITLSDIYGEENRPRFECKPGEAFILNLSAAVSFKGNIAYSYRY